MYNFALQKIPEIVGKFSFYKLIVDGKCEFDRFESEIQKDGNLRRELIKLQARMQEVADGSRLPDTKFKDLTPKGETVKEYELKTDHLRLYFIEEAVEKRLIICGGKKSTQDKDIKHFQKVKKEYLIQKNYVK